MSQKDAQRTVNALAKGVDAFAFRVANVAERMQDVAGKERIEELYSADFAALLTTLIVMCDTLASNWRAGVNQFLAENETDPEAIKRYHELCGAFVNSDLKAVWDIFEEHLKEAVNANEQTDNPS